MPDTDTNSSPPFTEQVSEKVSQQTQQVKDQAQQAVQQGQQKVNHLWELGRTQFRGALTGQKDRAADALGNVGQMLHSSADQMRAQGQPAGSLVADNFALKINTLSDTIHNKEIEEILSDTENFARRQPAAFFPIATLLGFLLARFLKSSSKTASAS